MRIKRFEAADTKTALAMVKKEMGENAVILATKSITPGPGFGGKPLTEVVAAMDFDLEKLTALQNDTAAPRTFSSGKPPASFAGGRPNLPIHSEIHDLQRRFASLLKDKSPDYQEISAPGRQTRSRPPRPNPEDVARWRSQLIAQLKIKPLALKEKKGPTIIALVGATGVGKTTTAAKLAAWFSIKENRRVSLQSMDCYRIGATDQLRTYARIMHIPCEIALRKNDLAQAINRHQNSDLIIIDTAGKNPYDRKHIKELNEWFSTCGPIDPYLVVSATSKKEDLANIIESYKPLNPAGLIISKLDETRAYATLCQQLVDSGLPVSCLCTGQRVPEDFMMASENFIGRLFAQGWDAATTGLEANATYQWQQ
ncbi:MAG: AAA family ATPase [Proteobacteria bacterium]|nr:AAA family ATPase [Pseudomonadota bacterium]MBU1716218.1 AAA family ATPase [Pseudomonadota bacterium]